MIVNGTQLCERKEVRTVRPAGSDEVIRTEVQHPRTIGDLSFEVVEVRARGGEDRIVNTEMTDSEVEAFQGQVLFPQPPGPRFPGGFSSAFKSTTGGRPSGDAGGLVPGGADGGRSDPDPRRAAKR